MFELNDYQKILCLALSSSDPIERYSRVKNLISKVNPEILYDLATTDELDSHLAWLFKVNGEKLDTKWSQSEKLTNERISTLMSELDNVSNTFFQHNLRVIALKNAGITRGIYRNNSCSPMGDIDLLILPDEFNRAHQVLVEVLGYTFKFRSHLEQEDLSKAFKNGGTEYFKNITNQMVWLELQWRPVAGRWIQPRNEPRSEDLFSNAAEIEGSKVLLLSPEDNLLQVSLHTAKHSYCRAPGFRLHSDVDRIVRHTAIDWNKFVDTVIKLRVKNAVYFSLYFAQLLLETPIPKFVFTKIEPERIRKNIILSLINKAGLFNQKKKKFSKLEYIILNLVLYDTLSENFKAIFPSQTEMKYNYNFEHNYLLPYFYCKRLFDLATKREKL